MTLPTRSERRAAERKANKQARKANQSNTATRNPSPVATPTPAPAEAATPTPAASAPQTNPISPAKLAANHANAQQSSGPRTEAGKQISSLNALKTALTGKTVLLPTDNKAAYESLAAKLEHDHQPATQDERTLVQSIIDTIWRLERIMNLEFALYTKGSIEFADQFDDLDPATRSQMIQVETFLKYEKSLRNLSTQEARLQRRMMKDTSELLRLQTERHQLEAEAAACKAKRTQSKGQAASPEVGFDFSNAPAADINPTRPAQSTAAAAS